MEALLSILFIDCYMYDEEPLVVTGFLDGICTPLGQEELASERLEVFPNPTDGILNIEGELTYPISITDLSGRVVGEYPAGSPQIDLSDLNSGVYLLRIGDRVEKVVVER